MKIVSIIFASYIGITSAAPAIVWKSGSSSSSPAHISESIEAQALLASAIGNTERDSALAAVVFLVGRDADGAEGLRSLTAAGKLPAVQEQYGRAAAIHHHVAGVESARTVARDARRSDGGRGVAEVTLQEFRRKLGALAQTEADGAVVEGEAKVSKAEERRRRAVSEADVLIVKVAADGAAAPLDAAVVAAIASPAVRTVVLASIRSVQEVKHARKLAVTAKFSRSRKAAARGRRLEDEANEEEENADNQDAQGQYYVNMTPNIFAGLMFFFLFAFVAHVGLTCMNMIEGQDVFLVKKYPHNGREA